MTMLIHGRGQHRSEKDAWSSLRLFLLYRIAISVLLTVLHFTEALPQSSLKSDNTYYLWTTLGLVGINLLLILPTFFRLFSFRKLVIGMALIDVIALTLLVAFSTGLKSGIGLIIFPSIAGASMLLPGIIAPLFAALGSIALLSEATFGWWRGEYPISDITLAGIHGILFFAVAVVGAILARKARTTEALIEERDRDLEGLSELNKHIVETMSSGIVVAGDDGRIRLINGCACEILNIDPSQPPKRLPESAPGLYAGLMHWLKMSDKNVQKLKADSTSSSEYEARFERFGKDKAVASLIYLQNLSERERELQEIKLAALGRLTASIAHEIRNPLGAISHAAQLLGESPNLDDESRRMSDIIQSNTRRMNNLIQDILNLSRHNRPQIKPFTPHAWLASMLEEYSQQCNLNPSQLRLKFDPVRHQLLVDPDQLHQILWNLLKNAQKYAQPEKQLVILIQGGFSSSGRQAWLDIIDNGKGIPEDLEKKMFEPFFTTGAQGTGLGLYITRELCEANNGSLEFMRLPKTGNCFRIRLPAKP